MKLHLLIISLVCLIAQQSFAQNWKTHGDSVFPGYFIGSTNNANLVFKTHDTLRMKIDSNGRIVMKGKLKADSATFNGKVKVKGMITADSAIFHEPFSITNDSGDQFNYYSGLYPVLQDQMRVSTKKFVVRGGNQSIIPFLTNTVQEPLIGMGVNQNQPNYMLDVLCTNTAGTDLDVNIACPTCGVPQSVGYRIGGNMFLWHGGDVTSVYTGVQAGNGIPSAVAHNNTFTGYQTGTSPLINQNNTFTGYQAGQNNINSNNTFTGYQTGRVNSGADNTFTGYAAGTNNTFGVENTFTGDNAGISNTTGNNNTFTGYDAGYSNNADYNTFTGWRCGFNNTVGHHNEFYGKRAGYNNLDGYNDCYYGSHCAFWTLHADSNVFMGTNTGLQQQGGDNVMIGWDAGTFNGTSTTVFNPYYSYYNVFIGSYVARNSNASWNTII